MLAGTCLGLQLPAIPSQTQVFGPSHHMGFIRQTGLCCYQEASKRLAFPTGTLWYLKMDVYKSQLLKHYQNSGLVKYLMVLQSKLSGKTPLPHMPCYTVMLTPNVIFYAMFCSLDPLNSQFMLHNFDEFISHIIFCSQDRLS